MAYDSIVGGEDILAENLQQVIDSLSGTAGGGQPISLTQLSDSSNYALDVANLDSSNGYIARFKDEAGNVIMAVTRGGVVINELQTSGLVPYRAGSTTLGGDATTMAVSSIPAGGAALLISVYARTDEAATTDSVGMRFNTDATSGNYYWAAQGTFHATRDDQADVATNTYAMVGNCPGDTATALHFAAILIFVPVYAGSTNMKAFTSLSANSVSTAQAGQGTYQYSGLWIKTPEAIATVTLLPETGTNFKSGSRMDVYILA